MGERHAQQDIWVFVTLCLGFALSFVVSVVPHYNGSYRLEPLLLAAWLLPYGILAVLVYFMRGPVRWRSVAVVILLQVCATWLQRGVFDPQGGALVYGIALLTAIGLLLMVPQLLGRWDEGPLAPLFRRYLRAS